MNAGRDMDALVAEKVMGWDLKTVWIGSEEHKRLIAPERHYMPDDYPWYSTDIAAAWMVVEKMQERFKCGVKVFAIIPEQIERVGKKYVCSFHSGTLEYITPELHTSDKADTAPLAICRAALKAIEEGGE